MKSVVPPLAALFLTQAGCLQHTPGYLGPDSASGSGGGTDASATTFGVTSDSTATYPTTFGSTVAQYDSESVTSAGETTTSGTTGTTLGTSTTSTGGPTTDGEPEVCDNVDNDLDGLIDEYSPTNPNCQGCVLGEFEGYAYAACSRNLTWNEAKAACISVFNGQLAKARDYQEFEFLVGLGYVDEQDYWLGASDAQTEGTFVWADGAAVGPYRPWLPSEPGDADWEDCVAIDEESGETVQGWDARDCDDKRAYMCMGANPW